MTNTEYKNMKIDELDNAAGGILGLTEEQIRWISERIRTLEETGFTEDEAVAVVKRYARDNKGWDISDNSVAVAVHYVW